MSKTTNNQKIQCFKEWLASMKIKYKKKPSNDNN